MPIYFQAAEIQDYHSYGGVPAHTTTAGYFRAGNARCGIHFPPSGDLVNFVRGSFNANPNEFWGKVVLAFGDTGGSTSNNAFLRWYSGGTARLGLQAASSTWGTIALRKFDGSWSTLLTSATLGSWITSATPYEFDYYIKIGNPGIFRLYRNGVLLLSSEALDLSWAGVTGFDEIAISTPFASNNNMRSSEIIVASWPTLGGKLVTAAPNAAGNYSEWAGGGYADVDEITPDLVTLTSATAGQRASFAMGDIPALATGESIASVRASAWAIRGTTGPQNLNHFARIGGADYNKADQGVTAAYTSEEAYWETSPATAAAWTVAEINGAEFGLRSRV